MVARIRTAPEWDCSTWFNVERPLTLKALHGRVVIAAAFQMLCPGCVAHTIPQMKKVYELFSPADVAVVGLHTVFEHHAAMSPENLKAFLLEYSVRFPVGVDRAEEGERLPVTMRRYAMQGTPTLMLIDRGGGLRRQAFGHVPDLQLGAEIGALIAGRGSADEA